MTEYRIVTNGIDYRIQWLGKTLFWRRPKWYWVRLETYAGSLIPSYFTKQEAQTALDKTVQQDIATKQGYVPVT